MPRKLFPLVARGVAEPLFLATLLAWGAVLLSMQFMAPALRLAGVGLMLAWLLCFLLASGPRSAGRMGWVAAEAAVTLWLVGLDPSPGTAHVLLVACAAQLATHSIRLAVAGALLADAMLYLLLRDAGWGAPAVVATVNFGFQLFAVLCAYYARASESARERLALANADLLATRALLADAARDSERVRVARDLHDVAGHKLTALILHLRALTEASSADASPQLRQAQALSEALLHDIRGVVRTLRAPVGLDLETALRALAAPLPRPTLDLRIEPGLRVDDPLRADAILRTVQEALTNAARHSDASVLTVRLSGGVGNPLHLWLEDDGVMAAPPREGNGLAGMRERIHACGGSVDFAVGARGALRIDARFPAWAR